MNFYSTKKAEAKVTTAFPGAIKSGDLADKIQAALNGAGYADETTIVATSLCCDEVNRELEHKLTSKYTDNFSMGGLAGFPFCGVTSFGAMAHHIPDGGNCLIVYGPHVGVDADGVVGKVNRRGRATSGACCGSATAAAGYVKSVMSGEVSKAGTPGDFLDAQQTWVGTELLKHGERLEAADDLAVEVPLALFDCQNEVMHKIVAAASKETHGGKIALVGGIQINTPAGTSDYFLPKVFEIIDTDGKLVDDLIASFA